MTTKAEWIAKADEQLTMGIRLGTVSSSHVSSTGTFVTGSGKSGIVMKQLISRASRGYVEAVSRGARILGDSFETSAQLLARLGVKDPEYTPIDDHIVVSGGDDAMLKTIATAFMGLEGASEIYYCKEDGDHFFTVVFDESDAKLGRKLAEVQVRAFKEFKLYVEATYVVKGSEGWKNLPGNSVKLDVGR
ncbi:hypothetical protein MHB43_26070 [Paenibacillus sp. FSL H8-0317]|uniref:hypothetical protein n=1 Tax=unclassified Paenibacillus TaxID=185978 RepID=UPI0032558180